MANIANLAVQLTAKVGGFTAGMKKAGRSVSSLTSPLKMAKGILSRFNGVLATIGVGVSFGSLIYGIRRTMEEIDDLAKGSQRLGFTTEALGAIRFAAQLAGLSSEQLTTAMKKMLNSVSEASIGVGEAQDSFKQLGIDVNKLKSLRPDQQFFEIKKRIEGVANASDRVRIAMDIFGRGGADILSLMTGSIADAAQTMHDLGTEISNLDAAKIEEANDTLDTVKMALKGIFTQLAIKIAPAITDVSQRFLDWAKDSGGVTVKVAGALDWIAKAFYRVTHTAQTLFKVVKVGALAASYALVKAFTEAFILLDKGYIGLYKLANKILPKSMQLSLETLPREEMRAFADSFKDQMAEASGDLGKHLLTPPDETDFANKLRDWWADVQEKATARAAKAITPPDAVTQLEDLEKKKEPLKRVREEAEKLQKALSTGTFQSGISGTIAVNRSEGVRPANMNANPMSGQSVLNELRAIRFAIQQPTRLSA